MRFRQSEISSFQRCRRKHHFRYNKNVVPVSIGPRRPASGKRDAGSAAHKGIEVINNGGTLTLARNEVTLYVNELRMIRQPEGHVLPPLTKEGDKEWWEIDRLARAMTENYVEWLAEGNDIGIDIEYVEEEWECLIPGTDFILYGMIDLAFFDPLVRGYVIRDNKSVAAFNQTPEDVDFQLRTYAWAFWRLTGHLPKRAEHLMMKRVLGTGKATPPFFERYPIQVTKRILESHEAQLIERCREIAMARRRTADHPTLWPNPTKDCSWDCDYRALCPMVDDGSDWEDVLEYDFVAISDDE